MRMGAMRFGICMTARCFSSMEGLWARGKTVRRLRPFVGHTHPPLGCGEPAGVYGGAECVTADGLPFIGPYSRKTPNLFVAGGYGGQGLIGAMLAAQIISARVLGLPGEGYDLYCGQRGGVTPRFLLGLAGRYAGGLAARHWAPRCPHMGCRLVYDAQARIWECPCHGSRFDDIGRVLSGRPCMMRRCAAETAGSYPLRLCQARISSSRVLNRVSSPCPVG